MMPFDVGKREDPVLGYNFTISLLDSSSSLASAVASVVLTTIVDSPVGGFNECSGLDMSLDVESYEEGGNNGTVLKFPTRVKWEKLVLKKGLTRGTALWEWFYGFVEGDVRRKDGVITLRNEQRAAHTVWGFRRGLPVRYQGPQLNAQQSGVAFETLEIEHEGLFQIPGASVLSSAVGAAVSGVASLF
jgi:phage tail-like protein